MRPSSSWIFFFMIEIFSAAKLQFSPQCAFLVWRYCAAHQFPLLSAGKRSTNTRRCTPLRQTPSHALPPNYRKRPAPFLRQFPVFDQNSACFSSSAAHRLTPLHNLRPTRARTHARQQLFDFCLHTFTRRAQFTHSQRIKCEGFCAFAFTAFRGFAPLPWSSD